MLARWACKISGGPPGVDTAKSLSPGERPQKGRFDDRVALLVRAVAEHADVEAELECACERLAADRRADPAAAGVRYGADEIEARHACREEH